MSVVIIPPASTGRSPSSVQIGVGDELGISFNKRCR